MTPRMAGYVLWDLDGTLVDSGRDIARAANEARRSLGFDPLPYDVVRSYVGEGSQKLMQRVMGEDTRLHAPGLARFLEYYGDHLADETRAYDGIDDIVRSLSGRQSITTNKPGGLARRLVSMMGWDGLFGAVLGGDDVEHKKPAADMVLRALELAGVHPTDAVLVGDTWIDIETARAAGIEVLTVTWGLRPASELDGAPNLVSTPAQLARALGL